MNVPENERFSAYLDGELTADEQAHVEQLISESPEARQCIDELRSLSNQLQALPAYSLGEDLSDRVLRKVERQMLDSSAPIEPSPAQKPENIEPSGFWAIVGRRVFRPRNLAWSGVAVGIALMLMAVEKWQNPGGPQREVAMSFEEDAMESADSRAGETETDKKARKSRYEPVPTAEMPTEETDASDQLTPITATRRKDQAVTREEAMQRDLLRAPSTDAPRTSFSQVEKSEVGQNEPLLVICEIETETVAQDTFQRILVEQKIPVASQKGPVEKMKAAPKRAKFRQIGPKTIAVDTNPTRPQLESMLAELRSNSKEFQKVADPVSIDLARDLHLHEGVPNRGQPHPTILTEPNIPAGPPSELPPQDSLSKTIRGGARQLADLPMPVSKKPDSSQPSPIEDKTNVAKPSEPDPYSTGRPTAQDQIGKLAEKKSEEKEESASEPTLLVRFILRVIEKAPPLARGSFMEKSVDVMAQPSAEVPEPPAASIQPVEK